MFIYVFNVVFNVHFYNIQVRSVFFTRTRLFYLGRFRAYIMKVYFTYVEGFVENCRIVNYLCFSWFECNIVIFTHIFSFSYSWKLNMVLIQFSCSTSFLKFEKYRAQIVLDPTCQCGTNIGSVHHFFFDRPLYMLYINHREILFHH